MVRFANRRTKSKQGIGWTFPLIAAPPQGGVFLLLRLAAYMMQCPRVMRDDDLCLAFGRRASKTPLESICGFVRDKYVGPARARSCGSDARLSCAVPVGVGACRRAYSILDYVTRKFP